MGSKRSLGISVAALVLVLAGVPGVGAASSAPADGVRTPGWAIQALPTPSLAPTGHLSGVSCVTAVSCSAVGYSHDGHGVDVSLAERWDGSRWTIQPTVDPRQANDTFLTGVSCTAAAACTAVGDFIDSAGRQLALAEQWNGRRWERQSMPSPADATETFLTAVSCTSPTACVAVGYSRHASQTRTLAEHWNGASWQIRSTPNVDGATGTRLSSVSCASGSACTAVGFSGDMFLNPQPVAERWNGTGWALQPVPQPAGSTQSTLSSVSCPAATRCVAVGHWHDSRKGGGTLAEYWDGTAWTVSPTPGLQTDAYTTVSCTAGDACLALGKSGTSDFVAARWDGTAWASTAAPAGGTLVDTNYVGLSCVSVSACVAVGAAETADFDFTYVTLAAGWNGTSWAPEATPNPSGATANELVAISCATEQACVAVGFQWKASDVSQPLVQRWDGRGWRVDSTPRLQGSSLSAVSCSAPDDCLAVGSYADAAGNLAALAEHWNGASWQVEPVPAPASSTAAGFTGVSCTTARHGDGSGAADRSDRGGCVAVGAYGDATGAEAMLVERRQGTTWTIQPAPAPSGTTASDLSAVSCVSTTACTAVGEFQTGTQPPTFPPGPCDFSCTLSEQWNGTTWQVHLPVAPQTSVNSGLSSVSCTAADACTAVGQWSPQDRLGGHPGITLAEYWDGDSWTVQATPDPPGVGGPNGTNNSPFEAVSCADPHGCTAVGNYDGGDAHGGFQPLAEHRDASGWSVQSMPAPVGAYYNDLRGVSCPSAHMCMAVGMAYRYNVANLSSGPHVGLAELFSRP